jgi:hypothetical protein
MISDVVMPGMGEWKLLRADERPDRQDARVYIGLSEILTSLPFSNLKRFPRHPTS